MKQNGGAETGSVELAGFKFDLVQGELIDATGTPVALRPQARKVLACLARQPNRIVSKDALMQAVWPAVVVTDDSLVQCVAELRRVLNDTAHLLIQTESRRGYRLVTRGADRNGAGAGHYSDEAEFMQEIRFATAADGVRIAYATSGDGLPVVRAEHWMTHLDWDWRSLTFGPRIQALSRRYRLLRYDGRGYGLSDRDATPGSLDQRVSDLEAVVDDAGLDRFVLYGPSGVAPISIRYAARHPERVAALVFLGGFARGSLRRGTGSTPVELFHSFLRLLEEGWAQDNPAFRQMMTSHFWPGATAEQMASFNHLQRVSCSAQTAVTLLRRIAEFDASQELSEIRCQTLVLHSPRDTNVPFEEGRRIAAAIPAARLETFDSPNHTPLVNEPAFDQVNRLIDAFLNETCKAIEPVGPQSGRRPKLRLVGDTRDALGTAVRVNKDFYP